MTACLIDAPSRYDFADDGDHVVTGWKIHLAAFVPDTSSSALDSEGIRNLLKLHDDVVKALLLNPTLNGTANFCALLPGEPRIGGIPELLYGEQHFSLEVTQYLSLEGLGPQ